MISLLCLLILCSGEGLRRRKVSKEAGVIKGGLGLTERRGQRAGALEPAAWLPVTLGPPVIAV